MRLIGELDWFDGLVNRLRAFRCIECFGRVHVKRFVPKEHRALFTAALRERGAPSETRPRLRSVRRAAEHGATECHEALKRRGREAQSGKTSTRGARLHGAPGGPGAGGGTQD